MTYVQTKYYEKKLEKRNDSWKYKISQIELTKNNIMTER